VYLSDFGLARGMLSSSGLTSAGQFLGTPDYAAPEQISGAAVDGRADQYGLACVVYTILAGSVPFEREQPMAVLYSHLFHPPPRVTQVRPDLPAAVDDVLARALAKEPGDRYDSCGAFADALRQAFGVGPYGGRTLEVAIPAHRTPATSARTAAVTMPASLPAPDGSPALPPDRPVRPAAAGTWTAVVTADRAYYDSVQVESASDADLLTFPEGCPERRFGLSGTEVRIGRRSASRHIEPEIDLTGPPVDPGVSRLHAMLIARPDGSWSVVDLDSPNGTLVNGREIPQGEAVPLRDGDRINLGAWTKITIIRG
jgi:hypothetical protein